MLFTLACSARFSEDATRRPATRGKAASGQRLAISPQLAVSLAGAGHAGVVHGATPCGSAPACGRGREAGSQRGY